MRLTRKSMGYPSRKPGDVFYDENAIRYFDPDHSEEEDRFLMLGMSAQPKVLVVSHCHVEDDSTIRIISARKATRREEETFWRERP